MSTIAGHTFENGRCACGRSRSDLRSVVYEFRAIGETATGKPMIAHCGGLSETEWAEMCKMVDDENKAFDAALADVCRI